MNKNFILLLLAIFAVVAVGSYVLHQYNPLFSLALLIGTNAFLFMVTLLAHIVSVKSMNDRPQAFVRGVFSGKIIKLFMCMAAVLIYGVANKGHIYKPIIIPFFAMYVLYSAAETWMSRKAAKKDS
jgi:hypothetical protein